MENVLFEVTKEKTKIVGFWLDDKGKVYIDHIKTLQLENVFQFEIKLEELFNKGEKAIFVIARHTAYVIDEEGKQTVLNNLISWKETRLKPSYIKALLKLHGGLTIYKGNIGYSINIWKE